MQPLNIVTSKRRQINAWFYKPNASHKKTTRNKLDFNVLDLFCPDFFCWATVIEAGNWPVLMISHSFLSMNEFLSREKLLQIRRFNSSKILPNSITRRKDKTSRGKNAILELITRVIQKSLRFHSVVGKTVQLAQQIHGVSWRVDSLNNKKK